jgi:serine/threonine-protein kinase
MKHVREELPDLQLRRPEISSALAAVVDRATAKDLTRRYADDAQLIRDLEDVLAIETSRAGQATGEATAILRTLPPRSRRRLPLRMRVSGRLVLALVLLGAAATAAVLLLIADHTQRGTGSTPAIARPPGTSEVSVAASAAHDYDPFGKDGEHAREASFVVDRDPGSTWSTETYDSGLQKPGVGIYIDAAPKVSAVRMAITTPTPGWQGAVYVASETVPDTMGPGWKRVGEIGSAKHSTSVPLDTAGHSFRYYLVWITQLPPDKPHAEIGEIELFRRR